MGSTPSTTIDIMPEVIPPQSTELELEAGTWYNSSDIVENVGHNTSSKLGFTTQHWYDTTTIKSKLNEATGMIDRLGHRVMHVRGHADDYLNV